LTACIIGRTIDTAIKANLIKIRDAKPRILASSATLERHEGPKIAGLPTREPSLAEQRANVTLEETEMKRCSTRIAAGFFVLLLGGCAYQAGYNPTYIPDEEPDYISSDEVLLVMADEDEDYVYTGSPSSFTGGGTSLSIPLGTITKEVAEEILEDRFSGRVGFANEFLPEEGYRLALKPRIRRFDYKYNSLKNLGFAITPEVDIDLRVTILDSNGQVIFDEVYQSGRTAGDTYIVSGSPSEKVNEALHRTLYQLFEESFADARPIVLDSLGIEAPESAVAGGGSVRE
jgi:hypothetical protein